MQSIVVAADAITVITINKESLALPHKLPLKCCSSRTRINCFPREGDFFRPLVLWHVRAVKGMETPPAAEGNGFAGILLPRTSLTSTAPARGKEHHQPVAEEKRVTSPIDEDLFHP